MTMYTYELINIPLSGDGTSTSPVVNLAPFIDQTFHKGQLPKVVLQSTSGYGTVTVASLVDNEVTLNLGWTPSSTALFSVQLTLGF